MTAPDKTSLGRLFEAMGVSDWDGVFQGICEKCSAALQERCSQVGGCAARRVISTMGGLVIKEGLPREAHVLTANLRDALEVIKFP